MPSLHSRGHAYVALAVFLVIAGCGPSTAQSLPTEPIVFGDGRVTVAGDVSGTTSCAYARQLDGCSADYGYFNFSTYDDSLLRNFRVNVATSVKASDRVSVLAEIRTDNLHRPRPYALFVRVRPWPTRRFDVQAGRIPPAFGAFSRRPYPADNFLVGYPLAYQYLTSLRPDALPANADELIRMRGRGWLSSFSLGDISPHSGLPLVNGLTWDTGIQLHAATDTLDAAVAVTTGTLGHPLVRDNNSGKQVSGRVSLQPLPGLLFGVSGAHGPYASRAAAASAGLASNDRSITQSAWEGDLEYSRGHLLLRAEAVLSVFHLPAMSTTALVTPLRAAAVSVEGRYRLQPGLYAAARWDHLGFSAIDGTARRVTWEAPVTRVEAGIGYSIQRNVLLKTVVQHNDRDGGFVPAVTIGAVQLVYWF